MIKLNSNNVNKIYNGDTLITGIDFNGASRFTYIGGDSPSGCQITGCPDVVSSIASYQGSAMEVYDQTAQKWYMRNNLDQYEEYGLFADNITTSTTYCGKLAKVDNTEYEWNGSSWVSLGESTGTTVTVQSPSYIYNDANHNFSIPLDYTASTDTKFTMRIKPTTSGGGSILGETYTNWDDNNDYRIFLYQNKFCYDAVNKRLQTSFTALNNDLNIEFGTWYIKNLDTSAVVSAATFNYQRTSTVYLGAISYGGAVHTDLDLFQLSALTMYHGDTLERDFIPAIDNGEICLYDKVSGEYFKTTNNVQPASGGTITEVVVGGNIEWPKDYDEKEAPANNVTFDSIAEMNAYECPYEGMVAYVDGDRYEYDNGEWVLATDWSQIPLTLEAIDAGQFKLNGNSVNYSLDNGATWTSLASNTYTPTVNAGERIMFKANISPTSNGVGKISGTGRYNAMGNPYCLLSGDSFTAVTTMQSNALRYLFHQDTNIISAENLALPATTLNSHCYNQMFFQCSNLAKAPLLPDATLVNGSQYEGMFEGTSVTEVRYMGMTAPSTNNFYFWLYGVPASGTFVKNANATWSVTCGASTIPCGWNVVTANP